MTATKNLHYFLRREDDEILMGRKGYWLLARDHDDIHLCLQFLAIDGFEGDQILVKEFEIAQESITEYDCSTHEIKTYDRLKFTVITETETVFVGICVAHAMLRGAKGCE